MVNCFFKNILTHFEVKYITLTLLKVRLRSRLKNIIAAPLLPLYHRHPSRDTGSEMRLGNHRAEFARAWWRAACLKDVACCLQRLQCEWRVGAATCPRFLPRNSDKAAIAHLALSRRSPPSIKLDLSTTLHCRYLALRN